MTSSSHTVYGISRSRSPALESLHVQPALQCGCQLAMLPSFLLCYGRNGCAAFSFRQHALQMHVFIAGLVGRVHLDSMLPTRVRGFMAGNGGHKLLP